MQKLWFVISGLGLMLAVGCGKNDPPGPTSPAPAAPVVAEPVVRVLFAGGDAIRSATNAPGVNSLFNSPAAVALWRQTGQKLARAPFELLRSRLGENTNDFTGLLEPLLADLAGPESYLEIRRHAQETPELAFAIKLDAARAATWRTNLATVLSNWTHLPAQEGQFDGTAGWEIKKHDPPNLLRFVESGGWVFFGFGQDKLPLNEELARRTKSEGRPAPPTKDGWLNVELNWPRLADLLTPPLGLPLGAMRLTWGLQDTDLRTRIEFQQPSPLPDLLVAWQLPTNLVSEPLVGATAARGLAGWLGRQPWLNQFKSLPPPNQALAWTLSGTPFQTYLAFPQADASNVVTQFGTEAAARFNTNLAKLRLGSIQVTNGSADLRGLLFVSPFARAEKGPAGNCILLGAFVTPTNNPPAPTELWQQIFSRTNLVYYDWELTVERLKALRIASQLVMFLSRQPQLRETTPTFQWLDSLTNNLGNTITEMSQTAPDTLTLQRKSAVGFTALELVALANWLDRTNFPWGGNQIPTGPVPPPAH